MLMRSLRHLQLPRAGWLVAATLVFSFFVLLFLSATHGEMRDSLMEFRQMSQQTGALLQMRLSEQASLLEQISAFNLLNSDGHLRREDFRLFVSKPLLRYPVIQSLAWLPRVDAAQRASFEAKQQQSVAGFEIRERNAAGNLQRAANQPFYFPLTYVEPQAANEAVIGYDFSSSSVRLAALRLTMQQGGVVSSAPLPLRHEQQLGMQLLLAVDIEKPNAGGVSSLLRMGDLIQQVLQQHALWIHLRVIDQAAATAIYDNFTSAVMAPLYQGEFDFGSRHYRIETAPSALYLNQHRSSQNWFVLAVAILGSGLLGALLLLGLGYTARLKEAVEQRTSALQQGEARLRDVLDATPFPVALADLHSDQIHFWSHSAQALFGYRAATLEQWYQLAYPDAGYREGALSRWQSMVEQAQQSGQPVYAGEYCISCEDGTQRICGLYATYLSDQLMITFNDVSERKQVEEKIKQSEAIFRAMAETIPLAIYVSSGVEQRYEYLNPKFNEMFGYNKEDVPSAAYWWPLAYPDESYRQQLEKEWQCRVERAIQTQSQIDPMHTVVTCRDGSKKDITWGFITLGEKNYAFGLDMTERVVAEQALHQRETSIRAMLDNIPFLVWQKDIHGRFVNINRAMAEMVGLDDPQQATGKSDYDLWPKVLAEKYRADDRKVMASGRKMYIEKEPFQVGSRSGVIETFKTAVYDQHGALGGTVGFSRDISERILAKEALANSYRQLKETQRASINIMEDMERKRQQLDASLREKEVMMREIHHRVKNNLQMISALLELQAGYVNDVQLQAIVRDSQQRIQSMAMIHAQLYHNENISRIDFSAYLHMLVDNLRMQLCQPGSRTEILLDVPPCVLQVDTAIPCGLVVNELVSNAMKHAFPDGRAGEIRIKLFTEVEGRIAIEVADNGVGMPANITPKEGAGFGMQVIRLMVEDQLHGKLHISSKEGTQVRCEIGEIE